MFERVPAWFKRLALDWDRFGWVGSHKAMRQAEKEIEAEDKISSGEDKKDDDSEQ